MLDYGELLYVDAQCLHMVDYHLTLPLYHHHHYKLYNSPRLTTVSCTLEQDVLLSQSVGSYIGHLYI